MEMAKKWLTFLFIPLQLLGVDRQVLLLKHRLATDKLVKSKVPPVPFPGPRMQTGTGSKSQYRYSGIT
jgi:hypothetical protein